MYHHHTQEEKTAAIELYIASGHSPTAVERTLGYPSRATLSHWHSDYIERGYVRGPDKWHGKFSNEQKAVAVRHCLANGKNASKTVRELGYPSHTLLGQWIDELAPGERKRDKPRKMSSDGEKNGYCRVGLFLCCSHQRDDILCRRG